MIHKKVRHPMKETVPQIMNRSHRLIVFAAALSASAGSYAQESPASQPEVLESVSVKMKRDGSLRPYAQMNQLLSLLQQHGQGLVRLEFKLEARDPKTPLPTVPKLAVLHADAYIPIAIRADGSFELPVLPKEQAKDAEYASNIAKGSANMSGKLMLTVKPEQLDMAMVRKIMKTARTLRSEVLPWYLRWAFPQIEAVRVCSAKADWELEWPDPAAAKDAGQLLAVPLSTAAKEFDPDEVGASKMPPAARRQCTTLNGEERWPDLARLRAPADASLSVSFQ